jgi:hypothetical protein
MRKLMQEAQTEWANVATQTTCRQGAGRKSPHEKLSGATAKYVKASKQELQLGQPHINSLRNIPAFRAPIAS